jgi:hypothetical protein
MDLDAKLCSAYAMNKMIMSLTGVSRERILNKILYECLGENI